MKKTIQFMLIIIIGLAGGQARSTDHSPQDISEALDIFQGYTTSSSTPVFSGPCPYGVRKQQTCAEERLLSLSTDDTLIVDIPSTEDIKKDLDRFYFIKSGGALPILDEDFRDLYDYGMSVTMGMEKKVNEKLSVIAAVDIVMLNGKWDMNRGRAETMYVESEETQIGFSPEQVEAEEIPAENLGTEYIAEAEAVVTSAESVKNIDIDSTMYILPVTISALYRIHEEGTISPYFGGGFGLCLAYREAKSKTLKENSYQGPNYLIEMDKADTVMGSLFQLFAGVELPVKRTFKIVAQANTTFYDLKTFNPILEVSHKQRDPDWYHSEDPLSSWSNEEPLDVGVFGEEYVSSLSIGFVMPF